MTTVASLTTDLVGANIPVWDIRDLSTALTIGDDAIALSDGEIEALSGFEAGSPSSKRAWEYWCSKAGLTSSFSD